MIEPALTEPTQPAGGIASGRECAPAADPRPTLLIPGHNDSDAEIDAECAWVAENLGTDVPLHFTAFHPDFKMRDVPPTPPATLRRAREIAQRHGLRFVYAGNVHDAAGGRTSCRSAVRWWWIGTGTGSTGTG